MKHAERGDLVDRIGREVQGRMGAREVGPYLKKFGLDVFDPEDAMRSKWAYAKRVLAGPSDEVVLKIADDLGMNASAVAAGASLPPAIWQGSTKFKLFISHVSADKEKAMRLRACLEPYSICGFVAHEDITPTSAWERELLRGLHTMDAFLSMHTSGFSSSSWTQQEIGFAVCRGVKIISFKMGEDPTGFLASRQALLRKGRSAEDIAAEIDALLAADAQTSERLTAAKSSNSGDEEVPF
jgi:hypothetical protein